MRHHIETCEPMGVLECDGCADEARELEVARREARALRAALKSAILQIAKLAGDLEEEAYADSPDLDSDSPTIRRHYNDALRARRVARRLLSLTSKR
jgi:hypothetical protein